MHIWNDDCVIYILNIRSRLFNIPFFHLELDDGNLALQRRQVICLEK